MVVKCIFVSQGTSRVDQCQDEVQQEAWFEMVNLEVLEKGQADVQTTDPVVELLIVSHVNLLDLLADSILVGLQASSEYVDLLFLWRHFK